MLLFTSGTSAEPKAAILEHDQLLAYIFNTLEFASAGEDEAAIVVVPPFHVAGVAAVLSNTYVGRRIVPVPGVRFSAEDWLVTARDEGVTHAMLVPTMLGKIVEAMEADESLRVPTLRALSYGGAKMHPSILRRALVLFPEVDFVNAYGLTETSSTVAILGPDDHRLALYSDEPLFTARLGSVGQPVPGIEFRIVDEPGDDARSRRARRDPHQGRPGRAASTWAPTRRSTPTAGSTPATAAGSTSRATCSARAAPTTPSSAAARTSAPPRSRTRCSSTTPSRSPPSSASPTSSTARRSRR